MCVARSSCISVVQLLLFLRTLSLNMSSLKTPPKLRRLLNELPENAGRIVGSLKDVEEASISTRDVIVSHDSIDTSTLYRSFDELRESIHNDWHGLISVLCLLKSAVNYVRQDKNGEIYKDGSWNAPVSSEWNDVQDSAKLIAVRFATTYKAIFIPFSRFLLTQPKRKYNISLNSFHRMSNAEFLKGFHIRNAQWRSHMPVSCKQTSG
ncbi:hypothetical protein BD410DRAFT_509145 [Rickenella mellea]|uniref:Uncharacterized protein n=1 Tax=Rickenella mellea TaxID=50990 RepID=A0A4Y7PSP5_9AGAM|nr:hypothetical protein BD410DRAFT_509145 [Rickenella mellea]